MAADSINTILQLLEQRAKDGDTSQDDKDAVYRLRDLLVRSVHLVDRGANGRRFVVVKRGADMPNENLGPEVVETEDGQFTTTDSVEKAGYEMAPAAKAAALKKLGSLVEKVKGAVEKAGAEMPPELVNELKALAQSLGGGSTEKGYKDMDEEEDEEKKKKEKARKAKASGEDDEDEEKKKEAKKADPVVTTHPLDLGFPVSPEVEILAKGLLAQVEKSGRKMNSKALAKFKDLVSGLQKMVDDLQPSDQHKAEKLLGAAFGKLSKRQDTTDGLLQQMVDLMKAGKASGATVADGQAATGGGGKRKVSKRDDDPEDRSWLGLDLNNDSLFAESADEATTFFDD